MLTRTNLIIGALVAALAYVGFSVWETAQAFAYRKAPSDHSDILIDHARGWLPHDALVTTAILHRGSVGYRIQTRTDLYWHVGRKHFSPWTTLLLKNDFKSMSDDEFDLFVESYPGNFNAVHQRVFGHLVKLYDKAATTWTSETDEYDDSGGEDRAKIMRLIRVLNKYPRGQEALLTWYRETIEGPKARIAFKILSSELCDVEGLDYGPVFRDLLPSDEDDDYTHLRDIAGCVPITGVAAATFSQEFQRLARTDPDRAAGLLPFVGQLLRATGRPLSPSERVATEAIFSHATSCSADDLYASGSYVDYDDEEDGDDEDGEEKPKVAKAPNETILRVAEIQKLFGIATRRQGACGRDFFESLASNDIALAEIVFKPYSAAPDSSLRKDMIVKLVNYQSKTGIALIDQAFTGKAPRTAQFSHLLSYIDNSEASKTYRRLATHDYLETGKAFPPVYKSGSASTADMDRWRAFVRTYPWFPGTDDAYYRLAYAAFASGDDAGAVRALREYAAVERPDQDAEPYMLQLVGAIGDREAAAPSLPADLATDVLAAQNYLNIPYLLALDETADFAACMSRTRAFQGVNWLNALRTAPEREEMYGRYGNEEDGEDGAPEQKQSVCGAFFTGEGSGGAGAIVEALTPMRDEIGLQLMLPLSSVESDQNVYSDGSLRRLTNLNAAITSSIESVFSAGGGYADLNPRTVGWFLMLDTVNKQYGVDCLKRSGNYCRSVTAFNALKPRLGMD